VEESLKICSQQTCCKIIIKRNSSQKENNIRRKPGISIMRKERVNIWVNKIDYSFPLELFKLSLMVESKLW